MMRDIISNLKKLLPKFEKARVLVIGDLMLDEFIWGKVDRISPEAPVPVVWVDSESYMPGGACNVANNIRALGGKVWVTGIVGKDERGHRLLELLRQKGIGVEGLIADEGRPTTLKTRIIAHHQQVVRIDRERTDSLDRAILNRITDFARSKIPEVDAVVIEDYGKGVIIPGLLRRIVPFAKRHNKTITVDPKEGHFSYYKGVSAITPNHHEAGGAMGTKIVDQASLKKVGQRLLKKLKCQAALITLGENGMCLFQSSREITHIPTAAQEVFDVSGAGDTVASAFTLALACGSSMVDAAHLSNFAAGIVVGKVGVAVATREELQKRITQLGKTVMKNFRTTGPLTLTLSPAGRRKGGG